MTIGVRLDRDLNTLSIQGFSGSILKYQENPAEEKSSFVSLQLMDNQTQKPFLAFVKIDDLREMGISVTALKRIMHDSKQMSKFFTLAGDLAQGLRSAIPIVSIELTDEHRLFFHNIVYANRVIQSNLLFGYNHVRDLEGVPGIYRDDTSGRLFINLKGTPLVGCGTYSKVRKVVWIKATSEIVAKKVLTEQNSVPAFQRELSALQAFSGKRGIVRFLAGGQYGDKYAIFMQLFECSLLEWNNKRPFVISLSEKLKVIEDWVEGLAAISEKGVHGDIKPGNLVLRRGKHGIEGAIVDFNSYHPYGSEKYGWTTSSVCSPEYCANKIVSSKQDVWALGLCIHRFFSIKTLPWWHFDRIDVKNWTGQLEPGWVLKYPVEEGTPCFVKKMIHDMLDPRPEERPSAKQILERFSCEL